MPFTLVVITLLAASAGQAQTNGPAWDWSAATPESQGLSSAKLEAMKTVLAARSTKALLVIRNDKIVYEWYAPDHAVTKTHSTASLAKAVVGGLSLAVALTDGRIKIEDKAAQFIPSWREDPRKSLITIFQLGSHTSGISDAEADNLPHDQLTGWKGDFWKRLAPPRDPFTLARDVAPTLFTPGEKLQYSNPGIAMMTYAVTATLRNAPWKDIRTLLRDRIMRPIGVRDAEWSIGYSQTFMVDDLPLVAAWGGANYTARALARVGRLMLRSGNWEGKQLLSAESVREVTSDAGTPGNGGLGWWSNNEGNYAKVPKDAFWGSGAGHQVLLVVPSLKLIAVRNGGALATVPGEPFLYHEPLRTLLFEPLMDTIIKSNNPPTRTAPYPPSPTIKTIQWAPKETILQQAKGSDNWPMTWADDDALYTAYGDGNGFEPFRPRKLSLGFAKLIGVPPDFSGNNLPSETGEQYGDGPKGRKASGMLMIDGVLYLWARNATNSQLAWSIDHGASWTWSAWKFTNSFGCPTFLNYGRNYQGARDGFVYVYSPDEDSAYKCSDRLVLARVPQEQVKERSAYEFFQRLDKEGQPLWNRDTAQRGAVFQGEGQCYRTSITYNAGLRRYLLVMTLPANRSHDAHGQLDIRFTGGLAIYDAPEPWGPWTTVYFSEQWDVGPGDTASLPTKWMSADGQSLHLVFSGADSFSVRLGTLKLANE